MLVNHSLNQIWNKKKIWMIIWSQITYELNSFTFENSHETKHIEMNDFH